MAVGFINARRERRGGNRSLYHLISEVTSHYFFRILLARNESLGPGHPEGGGGVTQGVNARRWESLEAISEAGWDRHVPVCSEK